ncbi:MAG: GlsB/YeaQ/YmgE family stress response membrane protein [Gemmatimonadaceae bacterium]|nr:GlsB/YeaQ/YmgE family stress response membrane protein [Gemmatimonadaceae bacterium]
MPVDLLTWIIVGLIAGVLASFVMGGGFGIIGDIVIGIVGAFLGGWIFRTLGVHSPLSGLAGTILVAFIGAVVLLFIIRLIRRGTTRSV